MKQQWSQQTTKTQRTIIKVKTDYKNIAQSKTYKTSTTSANNGILQTTLQKQEEQVCIWSTNRTEK